MSRVFSLKARLLAGPFSLVFLSEIMLVILLEILQRLFGYEPKEIYGKKTKILYTKEEEFKKQGETRYNPDAREMYHPYEIDYRKKNGDIFHSETVGTPVRNEKGEAIGLLAIG